MAARRSATQRPRKTRTDPSKRTIWHFGPGGADGHAGLSAALGGKGANLAEMCRIGLPVPPGFTIATSVCKAYRDAGGLPKALPEAVHAAIAKLEKATKKRFGDPARPLLVSVRSGAAVSMPGMMDTVLNLGLSEAATEGLAQVTGNRRFALDARRRFIQMFASVVDGMPLDVFEDALYEAVSAAGVDHESDLDEAALDGVVTAYLRIYKKRKRKAFPDSPEEQLLRAIDAVFGSWDGRRAVEYREMEGITGLPGTAVNVQAMVFGNLGPTSGTGVCFTRNPSTGENTFYGEYLMNAQGEDVVAGIRTPEPLEGLAEASPKSWRALKTMRRTLEQHYRDMQDIEFTIEDGTLYLLQTRTGKRTAAAAVRIAVELAKSRVITRDEALERIEPGDLDKLLHPQFDPAAPRERIARGLPASPGAVTGRIVFHATDAKERAASGEQVILVRNETSPEDVGGMHAAVGILTATGGMTSHAAVVARGMGTCCVAGAGALRIDARSATLRVGERVFHEGEVLSLDGGTGEIFVGAVATLPAEPDETFNTLLRWADKVRHLKVRANADTPRDAALARAFGAEGIGLCRTEHMFFGEERITPMREMILASTEKERRAALRQLLPLQRKDYKAMFKAMEGLPVTVRLLDPPLHEFLPHDDESVRQVAQVLRRDEATVRDRAARLRELNPMLGHRGCRLGLSYPEIYEMQVRALFEAAAAAQKQGWKPKPEVMIPLVGTQLEFVQLRDHLRDLAKEVLAKKGVRVKVVFGTMIETPRAALRAAKIAEEAEFFSFGTNDLTQLTFGYSRDDAGTFLPNYLERGILPYDPFDKLDRAGVGELVRMGTERGRGSRPTLKVGLCGEHGGEPESIAFCHDAGLDYVSCSPFRVPIARLAAARAALAAREP